ncbi:MAG: FKBP-type peptidyl-prolyl cis-trans isomerase, partial [Opitutales bacterium]|nr:FKBP-type peptidyl-prolyl cis-trans isomerase [Opitutales bacterium]
IGVSVYHYWDNSERTHQSERSYRFLSASIDSEGAEERFLSFASDYDDTLAGVARYRAAVIQYRDQRYSLSAENFKLAGIELGIDPLAGRALLGQAVSLLKDEGMKGAEGKEVLVNLATSTNYLPADRQEARFLLALQSMAENDMDSLSLHKEKLEEDSNASYFLSRLEDLIKTNEFLAVAKSLPDLNLAKGITFLKKNGKRKNVVSLKSGLQYQVITKGNGESPNSEDTVKVHYHGTLIDGEVFDSSVDREEPATFGVSGVIKGWTEALLLMKEGAKWKLFIPADLAYGETGSNSIGPNETLVFEVELLQVIPKPEEPIADLNSSVPVLPLSPAVVSELNATKISVPVNGGKSSQTETAVSENNQSK